MKKENPVWQIVVFLILIFVACVLISKINYFRHVVKFEKKMEAVRLEISEIEKIRDKEEALNKRITEYNLKNEIEVLHSCYDFVHFDSRKRVISLIENTLPDMVRDFANLELYNKKKTKSKFLEILSEVEKLIDTTGGRCYYLMPSQFKACLHFESMREKVKSKEE